MRKAAKSGEVQTASMGTRRKSKNGDQLFEFVVDVASGDMPEEAVFRASPGKNPAADALSRMGKARKARITPARRKRAARKVK
jgi:hypothetical protein